MAILGVNGRETDKVHNRGHFVQGQLYLSLSAAEGCSYYLITRDGITILVRYVADLIVGECGGHHRKNPQEWQLTIFAWKTWGTPLPCISGLEKSKRVLYFDVQ